MTLAELIIDFKNMVGPAGKGSEVSDSGIGTWLQEAYEDVVDEILRVRPDYFTKVVTTSTIAGQTEYALPSDFVKLIQVELNNDGRWVKVRPLQNIGMMPTYSNSDNGYSTSEPKYYMIGNSIGLQPVPTSSGDNNLKVLYSYLVPEIEDTGEPSIPRGLQRKLKYLAYANYLDQNDEHVAAERMRVRFEMAVNKFLDNIVVRNEDEPANVILTEGSDLYSSYADTL
jgi:hypothetical protein